MKVVGTLLAFLFCSFLGSSANALSQESIRSLASRALQQNDWEGGSWQDQNNQRPFLLVELSGQAQGSAMAYRVNPNDPRVGGADTITILYQVPALSWAGVGFSKDGNMVGSEAVLAIPETGEILKYNLGGKSLDGVQPMPAQQQTLVESGMIQDAATTTMAFTKIMREAGEIPISTANINVFLAAWGSSNTLGIHSNRQPFQINLNNGAFQNIVPATQPPQTQPPQTQPPINAGGLTAVPLGGLLQGSTLEFQVNPADARAGGKDTVTFVYSIPAAAWVGFALNDNGGAMIGSQAVIGLPNTGEVLKYNLNAKSNAGVVPSAQQTLIDTSVTQDGDSTVLTFTKIMVEDGEIPIVLGDNKFLGAWGSGNDLSIHAIRDSFDLNLADGATPPPQTQPPNDVDVVAADGFTAVGLGGQLQGSNLQFQVTPSDANAGGQDTITFVYTIPAAAWVAIAFSDNGGFMIGSEAVIGLPDTGEVLKYDLNAKNNAGVVPMADAQQTLLDTSVTQDGDTTILTFTKIMEENGEIPIILGLNTFLGAWGSGNDLSIHAIRDSFDLDLLSGGVEELQTRKQAFWKAHGLVAGIAWGFLSPLAIGASVVRKLFKGPLWFQIHRGLNMLVVLSTVVAFILAIVAINQETPEGASPNHFTPDPNPHRLIGLVIFIIALVQALLGIFRPHVPEKGQEKSTVRLLWEVAHKCLGYACLGMAIYQVQSGIKIYQNIFAGSGEAFLIVFWTVIAVIGGCVVFGFAGIKFFNYDANEGANSNTKSATSEKDEDVEQPSE